MKVSKAKLAENREHILESAGRLFRAKGFDGVGIAELMKTAGLTNGAFYGHFDSKEALIAAACERVLTTTFDPWRAMERRTTGDGPPGDGQAALARFVRGYFARAHVERRDDGCVFATLSGEITRQPASVRHVFTESLKRRIKALGDVLPGSSKRREQRALVAVAALVGALSLARAVDDPELAEALLDAVAGDLGVERHRQDVAD